MQQALPEDLWFFIILLALLILAYLWNDKAGSSGKKRKRTTTDPDPEPEPTTDPDPDPGPEPGPGGGERPPEIHAHIHSHSRFSEEVGDEFAVKATFDPGDGDVQEKRVEINEREVNIAEQGDGIFVSEPVRVIEGENVGKVSIKTTVGEDMDRTGFEASEGGDGGDGREDPSVRAEYEILDEQKGHVRIEATSIPGSLPIKKTIINISARGENVGGNVDESENCVFESKGLPHGNYIITAIAQDVEGNTGRYTEPFTLKMPGAGPSVPGGGLPGGIFNPQIEVSPEININTGEGEGSPTGTTDPEDYNGSRWRIFLQVIRESGIRSDVKDIILDILGGNSDQYPVSIIWVVRLMQIVESLPKEDVPNAAREVVSYTRENRIRNVSGGYFNGIVNLLERDFTLERKPLERTDSPYDREQKEGKVDEFFEETYTRLKSLLKESKKMSGIDEEAIEDFYEAMEVFERERALIQAFAMINQNKLQNALEEVDTITVKKIIKTAEQRAGVDDKLSDEQFLSEIKSDLQTISEDIGEAYNLLQSADDLASDEYDKDKDLEKAIEAFEGVYLNEVRKTLETMEHLME